MQPLKDTLAPSTESKEQLIDTTAFEPAEKTDAPSKNKVKRSQVSAPSTTFTPLNIDLQMGSLSNALPEKSSLSTPLEKPAYRLEDSGLAPDDIAKLQVIFTASPLSGHLGIFENLIFSLFRKASELSTHCDTTLKIETITNALNVWRQDFHFNLYEILIEVHSKHCPAGEKFDEFLAEKAFFRNVPQLVQILIDSLVLIEKSLSSDETKAMLLARFSRFKKAKDLAESTIKTPRSLIGELKRHLLLARKLIALPKETIFLISEKTASTFAEFPQSLRPCILEGERDLKNYTDLIATLMEISADRGLTSNPCFPNDLYRTLLNNLCRAAGISLQKEEAAHASLQEVEDQLAVLESLMDENCSLFRSAASGDLTHKAFIEVSSFKLVNEKSQNGFASMLLHGVMRYSIMIDSYAYLFNFISKLISEKNRLILPEEELVKIALTWHQVTTVNDTENAKLLQMVLHTASRKLARDVKDPATIELIGEYADSVMSIHKRFHEAFSEEISSRINRLFDKNGDLTWKSVYEIKKEIQPLREEIAQFRKKAENLNQKLQKQCDQHITQGAMTSEEAALIIETLNSLKVDISEILAPYLQFVEQFFSATLWVSEASMKARGKGKTIGLEIQKREIAWLFSIKPKPHWAPVSQKSVEETKKVSALPKEIVPKTSPLTLDRGSAHLEISSKSYSQKKESPSPQLEPNPSPTAEIGEKEEKIGSTKVKVLLEYLQAKGWVFHSIKGSHLKLKLRGESLIVPVSKPELKRGTLGAIIRQEAMKNQSTSPLK